MDFKSKENQIRERIDHSNQTIQSIENLIKEMKQQEGDIIKLTMVFQDKNHIKGDIAAELNRTQFETERRICAVNEDIAEVQARIDRHLDTLRGFKVSLLNTRSSIKNRFSIKRRKNVEADKHETKSCNPCNLI